MNIDFGKTVYVSQCGDDMIDALSSSSYLNPVMTGDGMLLTDYTNLKEELPNLDLIQNPGKLEEFLRGTLHDIESHIDKNDVIGDIVFVA